MAPLWGGGGLEVKMLLNKAGLKTKPPKMLLKSPPKLHNFTKLHGHPDFLTQPSNIFTHAISVTHRNSGPVPATVFTNRKISQVTIAKFPNCWSGSSPETKTSNI